MTRGMACMGCESNDVPHDSLCDRRPGYKDERIAALTADLARLRHERDVLAEETAKLLPRYHAAIDAERAAREALRTAREALETQRQALWSAADALEHYADYLDDDPSTARAMRNDAAVARAALAASPESGDRP